MDSKVGADVNVGGGAIANGIEQAATKHQHRFDVECYDSEGNLKWVDYGYNTVVNTGLDDILDKYYKGSTYTAAHYCGLITGGTSPAPAIAAGDTMASHTGWTENVNVSNSPNVRQTVTWGSVSGQSVDNSASKASFTIAVVSPDSQTIYGAFLTTDSTLGGTAGTLIAAAAFTGGNKVLNGGDSLNVTVTATAASA